MTQAKDLHSGDVFVECDEATWSNLSNKERGKYKRVTVERYIGVCYARNSGRLHWQTSAGDWCIPLIAPVTVVGKADAVKGGKRANAKRVAA